MQKQNNVTAVLIKYKRLKELDKIIQHLETIDQIQDIIVWDNTVVNMKCLGRYLGALQAKTDIIYFQDDDCIIKNAEEIISQFDGTQIISGMRDTAIERYKDKSDTLMGWGSVINKSWIGSLNRYIDRYGIDDVLLREPDRIFTSMRPYKVVHSEIQDFPSCRSREALYMQKDHEAYADKARKRAATL